MLCASEKEAIIKSLLTLPPFPFEKYLPFSENKHSVFIYQKVTQKSLSKKRQLLSSQEYEESTMPIQQCAGLKL